MSVYHARQIVADHAHEMDDSPTAFAMLRLCVAVVAPEIGACQNFYGREDAA